MIDHLWVSSCTPLSPLVRPMDGTKDLTWKKYWCEYVLDDLLLTMDVANGKRLCTLTSPTPNPTAGGPKKWFAWHDGRRATSTRCTTIFLLRWVSGTGVLYVMLSYYTCFNDSNYSSVRIINIIFQKNYMICLWCLHSNIDLLNQFYQISYRL